MMMCSLGLHAPLRTVSACGDEFSGRRPGWESLVSRIESPFSQRESARKIQHA